MYEPVHLLSLCPIVVSALYLYLGGYILRSNHRERRNQVFSLICLSFFFWSFAYTFLPGAPSKEQAWFWFKLSAVGWTISPSLMLHFLILLSGRQRWLERRWVLPAIYVPGFFFLLQALFGRMGVVDFVWTPFGWSDVYQPLTPVYATYLVFFPLFILTGLWLVWSWGARSKVTVERRQAQLIVFTGLPVLGAVALSGIFLPWMEIRTPPEIAHLIAPIWISVIWFVVSVYRLMVMTPAAVASDILRTMADAVLLLSREHRIVGVNEASEKLLGASAKELKGRPIAELLEIGDEAEARAMDLMLSGKRNRDVELCYRSPAGELVPIRVSASPVEDRYGQVIGMVLIVRDIREQKKVEAELEHLATHDPLTGLPNRSILHDRLQLALSRAAREKKPFALLMFDLDDFKQINDTYGQKVGDIVLQSTARRLQQCVRGLDTVCRLGADEFMVLVEDLVESGDSDIVARRIQQAFEEPIGAGTQAVSVTASVGISTYPFDGLDPETLVKKADLALSSSKDREKGGYQYYAPRMDAVNRERTRIEQGLRVALARDELHLVYQPLVDFESGGISGIEALLRWRSADLGMIGPNKFIPVAERSGLIVPIGRWVLETACQTSQDWQSAGLPAVPMGVNISAKQLHQRDFVAMVEDVLRNTGLGASMLELELTESAALVDVKKSQEIFRRLKDLGARIVIDDFGTGYSSLARLKQLPLDAVKVDRSFIENITHDHRDRALVMAIVAMARNLGVDVVAEGVETQEQLDVLRSFQGQPLEMLRCDKLQGYLFSRPVAKGEIPDLFTQIGSPASVSIEIPSIAAKGGS